MLRASLGRGAPRRARGQVRRRQRLCDLHRLVQPVAQKLSHSAAISAVGDQMPFRLRRQPAFQFAGPARVAPVGLSNSAARSPVGGKMTKLKFRNAPPHHHATSAAFCPPSAARINPRAVFRRGRGFQLVQHRRLRAGRPDNPAPSSLPRNSSTDAAGGNDDDDGLQIVRRRLRQNVQIVQTICVTGSGEVFPTAIPPSPAFRRKCSWAAR